MKRLSTIVMALVVMMTMSQCKKNEQVTPANEGVTITLDVNGGNGSRVDVNPSTGLVTFENGDQIHVANGGKYVGTLTYNGTVFTGAISNATEGVPLHFYFLGNVTPAETLTSGVTETCSVVISDQTTNLPVISYAPSNENYAASTTDYTARLLNKCALVKFNVTTVSSADICIAGMNNKMTVNFSENTLTPSKNGSGVITVGAGSGEKWAILLPQTALEAGTSGSAFSEDGLYMGTCGAVPAITENGYLTVGIPVTVTMEVSSGSVFPGAINGNFTINSAGDQVYFSKGNLQYQASTGIWQFAEKQYDYVGDDNSNISSTYDGWIDLFGWGTSGYNHGATCYRPWSSSTNSGNYYAYGSTSYNLYDQTGQADWGYNAISNGSALTNQWRTLTGIEWNYLFDTRSTSSGIRYAKAVVNGVSGIILLPDNWNPAIHALNNTNEVYDVEFTVNEITAAEWALMEVDGAVFLPAAGSRNGTVVISAGSYGSYWSSSSYGGSDVRLLYFSNESSSPNTIGARYYGRSVRLVHDVD